MLSKNRIIGSFFLLFFLGIGFSLIHRPYKISPGKIIILNGPSCVGKSSIIKAFQTEIPELWLEVGIDKFFVSLIPPKWYTADLPENHKVMRGIASNDHLGNAIFTLQVGAEGQKVIEGMHSAIAAYALAGCNVIVDYICYEPEWRNSLLEKLHGLNTICVGLSAPLETLELREAKRATSPKGHARSHHASVHSGWKYDLLLDTSKSTPEEIAAQILNTIK